MKRVFTLTITDEDGHEHVKLHLENIDPMTAGIVCMQALKTVEPKRKTRSDAGKKKAAAAQPAPAQITP